MTTKVKRLRLNADMRKKAVGIVKDFYESKNSEQKKIAMKDAKSMYDDLTPHTHKKIVDIIRGYQPQEDVDTIKKMNDKYNSNGGTVVKDSCFYIGHEVDSTDYNDQPIKKIESKHYDFTLYGTVEGHSGSDFAYAYYRDELKRNGLNPDINAEMTISDKSRNPYWTKSQDANDDYLGHNRYHINSNNPNNIKKQWRKIQTEVIGMSYCGSRNFQVDDKTYESLNTWQIAKSNVVKTHHAYVEWLQTKVKKFESVVGSYKYFDELQDALQDINCPISEAQLTTHTSVGLTLNTNLKELLEGDDDQDDHKAQIIAAFKSQRQSVN